MKYFAFCDPSGGSNDSMTLAVARTSVICKKAVLCGAWERKPPFNPDAVTEEFAGILKDYCITTITGDRYSAQWVVERFRAHNITYTASEKTKSEIFLEFLALVNADRIRIPANKRLRSQLISLERRTSRSGRDSVDHAPGAHDDIANAVAGALVMAAWQRKSREPFVEVVELFTGPPAAEWKDPRAGSDPYDPRTEYPNERWHKL